MFQFVLAMCFDLWCFNSVVMKVAVVDGVSGVVWLFSISCGLLDLSGLVVSIDGRIIG